ncbi:MAG: glycosyltransferase family 4 protein, partial [Bacteroidales bacterium]
FNYTSRLVKEVNAFIRYNPLVELTLFMPPGKFRNHMRPYTKNNLVNLNNPPNVHVHLLPIIYFTPDGKNKTLAKKTFNKADQIITCKSIPFDVIHAHFALPYGQVGIMLKRKYGRPLVVTCHGDEVRIPLALSARYPRTAMVAERLESVIAEADGIITYHEELRDLLLNTYKEKIIDKLSFFYKGINLEKFQPNSPDILKRSETLHNNLGISNRFVVLFLARVDSDKDPETFARAAAICSDRKDIVWLMVGDGTLKTMIDKFKRKEKLNNLLLVGHQQDTAPWYSLSHVYCALSPLENIWSTTLQEALCMGKPVVITNVGYVNKILEDQKDAYFIPSKDYRALAKAIIEIKDNASLQYKLSNQVTNWRKKFDMETTIKNTIEKYVAVLQRCK